MNEVNLKKYETFSDYLKKFNAKFTSQEEYTCYLFKWHDIVNDNDYPKCDKIIRVLGYIQSLDEILTVYYSPDKTFHSIEKYLRKQIDNVYSREIQGYVTRYGCPQREDLTGLITHWRYLPDPPNAKTEFVQTK